MMQIKIDPRTAQRIRDLAHRMYEQMMKAKDKPAA